MGQPVLTLEQVCKSMSAENMEDREPYPYSPPHGRSQRNSLAYIGDSEVPLGRPDTLMSEMNLLHMRGSICVPMSPSVNLQEMEQFALQAEDGARHAQQLADWANNIVCQLKSGLVSNDSTTSRSELKPNGKELPSIHEGSSVDPVSSSSTHGEGKKHDDSPPITTSLVMSNPNHLSDTLTDKQSNHVPKTEQSHQSPAAAGCIPGSSSRQDKKSPQHERQHEKEKCNIM